MACATVRVPAANRSSSNIPIGPFQKTLRADMIMSAKAAAEPGPMSNPLACSGKRTPKVAKAPWASSPTMSSGRWIGTLPASNFLHTSIWSRSHNESPIGRFLAARNVKHIPPPMTRASTTFINASTTPSLSLIFAPPRTATKGRFGFERISDRISSSFCNKRPAADGKVFGGPTIDACAR